MNEIVNILMRRDGMTRNEALDLIEECMRKLKYCDDIFVAENIVEEYLGLEPDYLDILLDEMM